MREQRLRWSFLLAGRRSIFLRTYATTSAIRNATTALWNVTQEWNENERDGAQINEATYRCGNDHSEVEKMNIIVGGLIETIHKTVIGKINRVIQ